MGLILPSGSHPSLPSEFNPPTLKDYVGQEKAKVHAQIMIGAALAEARSLPNMLIDGPPGIGKTTLARLIMAEMRATPVFTDGTTINTKPRSYFTGYLFVDEIHNAKSEVCDTLNLLLDAGYLHLIAATTNPGALPSALRSRLRSIHLDPYTVDQIAGLLRNAVERKKAIKVSDENLMQIAKRSRRNPRTAIKYLSFAFEYTVFEGKKELTDKMLEEVWNILGVDDRGLTSVDHDYLQALPDDRPVGIQYLMARLRMDRVTIEEEIEPYLMELGLVDRGTKGRELLLTDEERFNAIFGDDLPV